MIQLQFIGRVGQDAKVKAINDRTVTNFSVAVNEKTVNPETGEVTEKTTWINCALWRNEAGKLWEYLKRGQEVFIQGTPDFRIYKKQDKTPGLDISLRVDRVELIGGRKQSDNENGKDQDWSFEGDEPPQDDSAGAKASQDEKFWSNPDEQEKEAKKIGGQKILEGVENPFEG